MSESTDFLLELGSGTGGARVQMAFELANAVVFLVHGTGHVDHLLPQPFAFNVQVDDLTLERVDALVGLANVALGGRLQAGFAAFAQG